MSEWQKPGVRVRVRPGHPDTPEDWVGRAGIIHSTHREGSRSYRDVILDGDTVPTRMYPVELMSGS